MQGEFRVTQRGLERVKLHSYNLPHVLREGSYIPVRDAMELRDGDIIALCYSPSKGPYKVLEFRVRPLLEEAMEQY